MGPGWGRVEPHVKVSALLSFVGGFFIGGFFRYKIIFFKASPWIITLWYNNSPEIEIEFFFSSLAGNSTILTDV